MVTIWESDRQGRHEIELVRSSYLTVVDAQESNTGVFVCVAANKAGRATANVTLEIVKEGRTKLRGVLSSGITTGLALFSVLLSLVLMCLCCGVVVKRKRLLDDDARDDEAAASARITFCHPEPALRKKVCADGSAVNVPAAKDDDMLKNDNDLILTNKAIGVQQGQDHAELFKTVKRSSLRDHLPT
jgi:hypothetical protein